MATITRTISVPTQVTRTVTSKGPDGEAVTQEVTQTEMVEQTITEEVPDPEPPKQPQDTDDASEARERRMRGYDDGPGGDQGGKDPQPSQSDISKATLEGAIAAHGDWTAENTAKGSQGEKAPGEIKDAVRQMQDSANQQAQNIQGAADTQVQQLKGQAEELSKGKPPEVAQAIHDEADRQSASVYDHARSQVDTLFQQVDDKSSEVLKKSQEHHDGGLLGLAESALDGIKGAAGATWDGIKDVGQAVGHFGSDMAHKGEDAVNSVADFAKDRVADLGKFAEQKVMDPAMDHALGHQLSQYDGEKTGALGELVTNRLDVGQSAYIKLDADAKIEGVNVGAGAQLQVKRVPVTDDQGHGVNGQDGKPKTELEVTLVADARVGVGFSASKGTGTQGKDISVAGQDGVAGASASASVSAEAGVEGKGVFRFRFDPNNQQDMNDMTGIFKTCAKTSLESAIPGVGAVLAASNAPDLAKDAAAFGRHLTEVQGEVGVFLHAGVSAKVGAGTATKPQDPDAPEHTTDLKGTIAGQALDAAHLDIASISASLGGEVKVGADYHTRTGDTTVYLSAGGKVGAEASVAGLGGAGGSLSGSRTIALTIGKDGALKDVEVQDASAKQHYTQASLNSLGVKNDALAQLSNTDTIVTTYHMKPEQLASFRDQVHADPLGAFTTIAGDAVDPQRMAVEDVRGIHTDEVSFGFDVGVVSANITLGKGRETELSATAHDWNTTIFNDPTTKTAKSQ